MSKRRCRHFDPREAGAAISLRSDRGVVTSGGGAVKIKVNGGGKFIALELDPDLLKEDAKFVADTILTAMQDAAKQSKEYNDAEMQKVTSAFQVPGMF